jgi:membrane protein insertase Oxa1/YidC/SpoIIIJ
MASRSKVAARERMAAFLELLLPRTAKMNPITPNLLILLVLLILVGFYYLYRTHPEMFQPHHASVVTERDPSRV